MKRIVSLMLILTIFLSLFIGFDVSAYDIIVSDYYNSPSVYPKKGQHPRMLFTSDDISRIKSNLTASENSYAYENFKALLNDSYSLSDLCSGNALIGVKPSSEAEAELARLEAKAFNYAINGDREDGYEAISGIISHIEDYSTQNVLNSERYNGYRIFIASLIYDWCNPLLTNDDKERIVNGCVNLASTLSSFVYPPTVAKQNAIAGHGAESFVLRDLYAFSIAVYDDYPDIYEYMGSFIEKEYVPIRNEWYASHSFHQGSSYGPYRFNCDMWSAWLYRTMSGGKDLYSPDMQYALYQMLYYTVADGQQLNEGDATPKPLSYTGGRAGNSEAMWLTSSYFNDPYLKAEQIRTDKYSSEFLYMSNSKTPVQFLILNNPELIPADMNGLPKTKYFGYPNGTMVAKTGWDNLSQSSDDMTVIMKIGQEYVSNHQHLDFGTFQIYYKGILTGGMGMYREYSSDHDLNYNKETVSHNGLLIYDPNEVQLQSTVNSGGQRRTFRHPGSYSEYKSYNSQYGKVIAHGFDKTSDIPKYSYISGDITNAYSDKVSEVRRSMLFMPNDNKYIPGVFFVADKIVSKDSSFDKTFVLQTPCEPAVSGNQVTVKRASYGYNGKLVMQTLYPENPVITKQGGAGYQWYAGGRNIIPKQKDLVNYESSDNLSYGWGKILVSPATEQKEDYFLNAIYVSDANSLVSAKAEAIKSEDFLGAELEGKRVFFAKSSTPLQFEKEKFVIETEKSNTEYEYVITGLSDGRWKVFEDGVEKAIYTPEDESGLIYFKSKGGKIELDYLTLEPPELDKNFFRNESGERVISWSEIPGAFSYSLIIKDENGNTVYENYDLKETSVFLSDELLPRNKKYSVSVSANHTASEFCSNYSTELLNAYFSGGNGDENSPYIISDANDFLNIKNFCGKNIYFSVLNNIDLSQCNYESFDFSGIISGKDDIIRDIKLAVNIDTANSLPLGGLFNNVEADSYIGNLSISGSITSNVGTNGTVTQFGGFIGNAKKGVKLENLENNAEISGNFLYLGGILGGTETKTDVVIANCSNNKAIVSTGNSGRTGGIVCKMIGGEIINCANKGDITTKYFSAGILAWSYGTKVSECYNAGSINALNSSGRAGGIVGLGRTIGNVSNCYNSGSLTAKAAKGAIYAEISNTGGSGVVLGCYDVSGNNIGNVAVYVESSSPDSVSSLSFENCYVISDTPSLIEGITSLNIENMKLEESFKGFDFENIWIIRKGSSYSYPMLRSNLYDGIPLIEEINFISGNDVKINDLIPELGFNKYSFVKNKPFIIVCVKADLGNFKSEELGITVDGKLYLPENESISSNNKFVMLLYKNNDEEITHNIKGYLKYVSNGNEIIVESNPLENVIFKSAN